MAPDTRPEPTGTITPALLVTLALLSAVAPFATDLYLPAFPTMVDDLHTSATAVQLTLTAFLLGLAAGQLLFGPLSDRFGRVRPLLVGAAVCVVASATTVFAPTIEVLIGARFAQGVAGAAGMVIGRAIIADLASGKAAARAFSLMMIVGGVAPVIAPLAGGFLVGPIGWRGALAVILGLSTLMLLAVVLVVRETHTEHRRAQLRESRATLGSPLRDLLRRVYLGHAVAFCGAFATMMAYISASPFIYQSMMGLSAGQYGAMFGVNALALLGASALSARLIARVEVRRVAAVGMASIVTATVALLALALSPAPAGWLALPLLVIVGSMGLIFGNTTALALGAAPRAAGMASAVLGALQFGVAAAVSPLVSIAGEDTAVPAAIVMVCTSVLAVTSFAIAGRRDDTAGRRDGSRHTATERPTPRKAVVTLERP
ncbi:Bcr/CflA family drug resistance efflux transporter [Mycolicibacterium arabiense]|uniref:Bcr/CflA family drug resistance efflux transporter n=1 Tax=Mycolicibacterium arabiense TaxID=1286181 RepID=A0A7I7S5Y1_9MYCO|nr:multidrug effflux MFS transporter [Mycolicibacterium arabiense]MCV7376821.1 multidrug effflux MFS transporter [Mycolicibacterium arabiense]BBY52262.1 Bcr/CflA family drug resistance efflux transporter [Mycolicibacterium arabiense]